MMEFNINEHGAGVVLQEAEKLRKKAQDKIEEIQKKLPQVDAAEVDKLTAEMQEAQRVQQYAEDKIEEMKALLDS